MRPALARHVTAANALATAALLASLAVGLPALAGPLVKGKARSASIVERARGHALAADRRSKRALARARRISPGPRGEAGPKGPPGDPGPVAGAAGGDLLGTYPDPVLGPVTVGPAELLPGAVGASALAGGAIGPGHVAPDSIGGGQVLEHTLVGLDVTSHQTNSSRGLETLVGYDEFSLLIGNEILLTHRCFGPIPQVGFRLIFRNTADAPRTVYASAMTAGDLPDLDRFVLQPNAEATIELPGSSTPDLARWVTLFTPAPEHELRFLSISTRSGELGNDCWVDTFRRRISDGFVR